MVADIEEGWGFEEGDDIHDSSTHILTTMLLGRAKRLQEWASMNPRAPARFVHEEMRLIYEAFEALSERFGMERGENCTQCEEGYYSYEHCTYCGHEEFQGPNG